MGGMEISDLGGWMQMKQRKSFRGIPCRPLMQQYAANIKCTVSAFSQRRDKGAIIWK